MNLQNQAFGDRDSVGWRQARSHYGSVSDRLNLDKSVSGFMNEVAGELKSGKRSSEAAANVQRPAAQYRGRYKERAPQAEDILKALGGGGASKSVSGSTGGSGATASVETSFDKAGFEGQRKKAILGSFLQKRNPNSMLLRLGVVGTQAPAASDFTKSELKVTPGKEPQKSSGGGSSGGGGSGDIRYGSAWGGSQKVVNTTVAPILKQFGVTVTSAKRSSDPSGIGTQSDHHVGNKTAYANDLPATGQKGEQIARAIAKRLGIKGYSTGNFQRHTVNIGGKKFSAQILWNVQGHHDHVHYGIRPA